MFDLPVWTDRAAHPPARMSVAVRAALAVLLSLAAGCAEPQRRADALYDRTGVLLEPAERDYLLAEMRHFVQAVRGIIEGIGESDMKAVAAAARAAGTQVHHAQIAGPGSAAASAVRKLPPKFRALGLATHGGFDEIALHAEQTGDRDQVLALLADNLRRCVACHAAYRFPE
jgi:hypothetical protein